MSDVYRDRVRETTTTTGTGTITLAGPVAQYQGFANLGDGPLTCRYTLVDADGVDWEVGIGTFDGGDGLARTTVLDSSNGGSAIDLSAGTHQVFLTPDATALAFIAVHNNFSVGQTITSSAVSGDDWGLDIHATGADSSAAEISGAYIEGKTAVTTVNVAGVVGVEAVAQGKNPNGKTCTNIIGALATGSRQAAGSVTNCIGVKAVAENTASGSLVNGIGVYVPSIANTGGGTITNAYGVKIDNIDTGTSLVYAIFTGTGWNYLGDRLTWKPPASITPNNNGDLTFEATSNTTITVKYKGSDGTVRSGTITLS